MIAEKDWCAATDFDQFKHVWEGEFRTVTEAQILRGKYVSEMFDVDPQWSGPHYGLDFGFSQDPTAATLCYVDDATRTLYIAREYWQLGAGLDSLPDGLKIALPGIDTHTIYCDCAQPAMVDYLARHGLPGARPCEKWSGSVDDGIAHLRAFSRIVIHPACVHTLDEANRYSFKVDRLTGNPLPEPDDRHNHCIDSIRYGIGPIIRNKRSAGYFARQALLVRGEPVEPMRIGMPECVFMTVATCDQPGTAVGVIFWSASPQLGWPLVVLDYDLVELEEANESWFAGIFARAQELHTEWRAMTDLTAMWAEEPFYSSLGDVFRHYVQRDWGHLLVRGIRPPVDLRRSEDAMISHDAGIRIPEVVKYEPRLDVRAERIRSDVNGGRHVKLARSAYTKQVTFRSTTSNTLLAQLLSYRPGQRDAAQELVAAFVDGLRLTQFSPDNAPTEAREIAAPSAPVQLDAPAPRPKRIPGVGLTPGEHMIDGQRVVVKAVGQMWSDGTVFHPLPPGPHEIDKRWVRVTDPNAGITVSLNRFE
jgi:hypothetical protein